MNGRPGTRTAACCCGALTATVAGAPEIVAICHCTACQRRSGTAFGHFAWWPEDRVTTSGPARHWSRRSDRGRRFEQAFCPSCGSAVLFRGEHLPGMIGVAVGCFADPDFPAPSVAVWCATRQRWLDDIAEMRRLEEQRS